MMKERLSKFIPLIRFYHISSEDFLLKVHPFKKLLPDDLNNDILVYHMKPNKNLRQPPRCASIIIKYSHFSILARLIEKKDTSIYDISSIPYNFKLLYRSSRDGNEISTFHKNCDKMGSTIVIAKIKNSNQIVGGYNPFHWDVNGLWKSSNDSFLFSFKDVSKFQSVIIGYSKGDPYSIHCGIGYGPMFGIGMDLVCNANGIWTSESSSYTKTDIPSIFEVDDYEVFQVIKK
ncbi:hypothetical protein C1645_767425 [Glomus cerebriforme]|uniref:TLDc domain-containing protein n=1 Tax=Glomus cerebriforme TaxID=658196 RepID=A0A397SZT0_9GLOM|nr:hypothetical protein C1645_767425 [Glomus cerebriforme]